jgi:alpha-mannosidase
MRAAHIRSVTWREYLKSVAIKPEKDWRFSIEDILVTLPWGEKTLQTAAQQVRSAEIKLLAAEKLSAMAWLEGRGAWPGEALQRAWDDVLWAQHHDSWITITTRAARNAWAFQVGAGTMSSENTATETIAASAASLSQGAQGSQGQTNLPLSSQWVRAFNTLGWQREDLAELTLATDRGTKAVRVTDAAGKELPSQIINARTYAPRDPAGSQTINTATVLFRPSIPSLGYSNFRVEPVYENPAAPAQASTFAQSTADGTVLLENDLYRLKLDPARGGAITSLILKSNNRELCDPNSERAFNEYRGYFIEQKEWRSSTTQGARVTVLENGPLRARARVAGSVGGCPFQTTITLVHGQRRIEFQSRFVFEKDTWIGDPWDIAPAARRTERRRSPHDGRWKLQALFPVNFRNQAIYKDAAFDVCRSRNTDTYFQRWDEIKHNIIFQWVDSYDEGQDLGVAVYSDHTTGYTHGPDHPLSLVLGWGWEGGFWWGKCPLRGTQQVNYAIVPHTGRWDQAALWKESCQRNEPPVVQLVNGNPEAGANARSYVSVSGTGIEIPTLLIDGNAMLVRLFNAEGDETQRSIEFHRQPARVELVELDGRVIRQLPVVRTAAGRYAAALAMPRFAIRTLRCRFNGVA